MVVPYSDQSEGCVRGVPELAVATCRHGSTDVSIPELIGDTHLSLLFKGIASAELHTPRHGHPRWRSVSKLDIIWPKVSLSL